MKNIYPKKFSRAGEMAQWLERLAIETDDLNLIPRTHMMEGEKRLPKVVLTSMCMSWHMSTCVHTNK